MESDDSARAAGQDWEGGRRVGGGGLKELKRNERARGVGEGRQRDSSWVRKPRVFYRQGDVESTAAGVLGTTPHFHSSASPPCARAARGHTPSSTVFVRVD